MGQSRLRKLLEAKVCEENISVTFPNAFLPPRFRRISDGRDMILLMDRETTLHVRWQGLDQSEHRPLTRRAANRLIQDVLRNMGKYRTDLYIYSRFLERWADDPEPAKRYDETLYERTAPPAEEETEAAAEEEAEVTGPEIAAQMSFENQERFVGGGESPLPPWDD